MADDAIFLVGHGSVTDVSDLPEFLRRIRRGAEPSAELIEEITRRHEHVGGSPLLDITKRQARALERRTGLRTHVAMRMWNPFIEDVLRDLAAEPPRRLCVLPTAPFSVHVYAEATRAAAESLGLSGVELVEVPSFGSDAGLVAAHADAIRQRLLDADRKTTTLILTAHSLPLRTVAAGDPYQTQFEHCARCVAQRVGWPARVAYQSQGARGEWLGPTVEATLAEARDAGAESVVVAPIGFLAEHVETLFDLDVEAARVASELGLGMERVEALNDDAGLIETLASLVESALS